MTEQLQSSAQEMVNCYLCDMNLPLSKSMEVPLTTGGAVRVHPSCMEFYLSKASASASSCGGCSGGKGCC